MQPTKNICSKEIIYGQVNPLNFDISSMEASPCIQTLTSVAMSRRALLLASNLARHCAPSFSSFLMRLPI